MEGVIGITILSSSMYTGMQIVAGMMWDFRLKSEDMDRSILGNYT